MEAAIKRNIVFLIGSVFLSLFLSGSSLDRSSIAVEKIGLPDKAVSKKNLDNGLTVLALRTSPGDPVSVYIKIRAGSSLEEEYLGSGISHLVEHMIFKGTASRKPGQIEKEIKSYGGFTNGSTTQDITDFHITLPSKYLPQALELLKDMLLNAKFDKDEFAREKDVVLKEINLNNDEPQSKLYKLLNKNAYLRHAYMYPPIGYEKRFRELTRDDAVKYYNRMYAPNRMVVAIVGGIDEKGAIAEAENEFKAFRAPNYSMIGSSPVEPEQIDKRSDEGSMQINLAYLAMGFHSTGILDKDLFSMDLLAAILGRGNNSRLNTVLFKDKRLVHTISSWNYTPKDPGLFVVTAILDKKDLEAAEACVMDEINKIAKDGVGDGELETAKHMMLGDYIFSLQTTDGQANDISTNYILTGSWDFSRRYVKGMQDVTKDDIKKVASVYLRPDNLTTVRLVGMPEKAEKNTDRAEIALPDTIKKIKLDNGVTILMRENKKTPTISISVAMRGGLGVEDVANNGISNLTSTMLLKGTSSKKESQIIGAVEAKGGSIETFNGFNSFGITMELLKTDLDEDLSLLKDILGDSVFPQDEIVKIKNLILADIKSEDDDIFQNGVNALRKEIFSGTPYAFRYLGDPQTVMALGREEIAGYYKKYCTADNMVVSISGDIDTDELAEKMKRIFGTIRAGKADIMPLKLPEISSIRKTGLNMERDESLLLFGFRGAGVKEPDKYPLDVMVSILSGQSGRMFETIRGKESIAYTLGCSQKTALDTGFMVFYIATVKDKLDDARKLLTSEIVAIREKLVTDEELENAKRELTSARNIAMQTNLFYSSNSAMDELYGLGYDNLYKYRTNIEQVTKDDIKRTALKYLTMDSYAEVVISPKK